MQRRHVIGSDDVGTPVIVERRRSLPPVLILVGVAAVLAIVFAVVRDRGTADTDDVEAEPDDRGAPALIEELWGTAELDRPVWLTAGPAVDEGSLSIIRLGAGEPRQITAPSSLDVGGRIPVFRGGDAIVWSDGRRLFRTRDDLTSGLVDLAPASDAHPFDAARVWVEADGRLLGVSLADGETLDDLGPVVAPLRAPLTEGAFIVAVDGAAGVWFPGGRAGRVATSYIASNEQLTVLSGGDNLVLADTGPFLVRATLELADDLVIRGPGALSPDGQRVAVHAVVGASSELAVIDLATGDVDLPAVTVGRAAPIWLDDDRIVVVGADSTSSDVLGRATVWLVDLSEQSGRRPLVPLATVSTDRSWVLVPD